MTDERVVLCETCGSEGRIYERVQWYDRQFGYQDDVAEVGPCPWCEGTGGEVIVTQPIELEDLDEACGPLPAA